MSTQGKAVEPVLKARIVAELIQAGSSVVKLSRSYGVSESTLYKWRNEYEAEFGTDNWQTKNEDADSDLNHDFIELKVSDRGGANLKSASLQFNDFSIALEGKISSDLLMALVKTVEGN